ncbi:MAG: hypothetical protein ACOC6Q_00375 [Patescibacteria group bacterium]
MGKSCDLSTCYAYNVVAPFARERVCEECPLATECQRRGFLPSSSELTSEQKIRTNHNTRFVRLFGAEEIHITIPSDIPIR